MSSFSQDTGADPDAKRERKRDAGDFNVMSTSDEISLKAPVRRGSMIMSNVQSVPYWLIAFITIGAWVIYQLSTDAVYGRIFTQLRSGIYVTLFVSFTSYSFALIIGVIIGLIRAYPPDNSGRWYSRVLKTISYNTATFYLELFRGLPILVVLLIITFVAVPQFINFLNAQIPGVDINGRDVSYTWRAIIALSLAYGAFLSEVFRAGIQSVPKGQIEAAQAVGLNGMQTMRYVVLPQAFRVVLPPLGNDLIAMIKDSSLVAILAVRDITQLAKLSAGQSFLYLETYLIAAALYLFMTIIGSLLVRGLERLMGSNAAH